MTTDTDLIRENNQEGLQVGDFKVGDRVLVTGGEDAIWAYPGHKGTVVAVESGTALLKLDNAERSLWYDMGVLEYADPEKRIDTPALDFVSHPPHYVSHPSGIECIEITEHMGFNLGNAVKYLWRCDLKQDAIEDLKKARWYIEREIAKREAAA